MRASVVLPLPDSPTSAERLAGADRERDAGERADVVAAPGGTSSRASAIASSRRRRARCGDASPPRAEPVCGSSCASAQKWQRLTRPAPTGWSGGSSSRQISRASPQRSANTQPGKVGAERPAGARGSCPDGARPCRRRRAAGSAGARRCTGDAGHGRARRPGPPRRGARRTARRPGRTSAGRRRGCG